MTIRLFQYALPADPELPDLNAWLASHRIATVHREIVRTAGGAMLVFVVETVGPAPARDARPRVDYREELSPEEFRVFSRLREVRKALAEREGVPVYSVATNAQLAQMIRRRCRTLEDIQTIEGMGEARSDRYGEAFLRELLPTEADQPGAES